MSKAKQKQLASPIKITTGKSKSKAAEAAPIALALPKQQMIIDLLKRPHGASLKELMEETGWQRHSVRGTLSGVLKKRLGLCVIAEFGERGRIYRIPA